MGVGPRHVRTRALSHTASDTKAGLQEVKITRAGVTDKLETVRKTRFLQYTLHKSQVVMCSRSAQVLLSFHLIRRATTQRKSILELGKEAPLSQLLNTHVLLYSTNVNAAVIRSFVASETAGHLGPPATSSSGTAFIFPAQSLRRFLYLGKLPHSLHTAKFPPQPSDCHRGRQPPVPKKGGLAHRCSRSPHGGERTGKSGHGQRDGPLRRL